MSFLSSGFFLSATETKLQDSPVPSAVPVVTPEEAEKLNDFAIFLTTVPVTIVEGEITERSELPDPEKSDYPNCRFTVHFNGNTIKSGEPCPKELSLIVEGFENYHILPYNNIKPGDKVLCTIFPFDQLPEDYQSTQQADDLELFLLESYYVIDIKTIRGFSDDELMPRSGIYFSDGNDEYISIFDRHINPPIPDETKKEQETLIEHDLSKMLQLLEGLDEGRINRINESFSEAWNREQKKDSSGYNRISNYIVWRNIDNSFWCLPIDYTLLPKTEPLSEETIHFFMDLRDVLESNGASLIVSLVPDMYSISSRVINREFLNVPDVQTVTVTKQLLEHGIETIYVSDELLENYNRFPFAFFYPKDNHPSDTVQDIASDILAKRIARFKPFNRQMDLDPNLFEIRQMPHVFGDQEKYMWPSKCDIGRMEPRTAYKNREVFYNGKTIQPDSESEILVVGNSYIRTPMESPCSLPTLLSYKTGYSIDSILLTSNGPFVQFPKMLLSNPERYLKKKKTLIFQVGLKHLFDYSHQISNIREIDETLLLLKQKKLLLTFVPNENEAFDFSDDEALKKLDNPHLYSMEASAGKKDVAHIILPQEKLDSNKQVVCLIPCVASKSDSPIHLEVNGLSAVIPIYYTQPNYVPLSFILPPGTTEINVSAFSSSENALFFALSNIQIYQ